MTCYELLSAQNYSEEQTKKQGTKKPVKQQYPQKFTLLFEICQLSNQHD
jgi:hypothetical protein